VDELLGYRVQKSVGTYATKTSYWVNSNHLYSVAAVSNSAGAVVERCSYNAYGEPTIKNSANATIGKSAVGNDRGFTGRYPDKETGLLYFRARYYSGTLGRFIGRDSWMRDRRVGSGGITFVGRPALLDGYRDGPNLYAAYFVPGRLDPTGEYRQEIPGPAGSGGRCGWIDIDLGKEVRARVTKDPKDCGHCCKDYGFSQTMCTASGVCYYDNSSLVFEHGQNHNPSDRNPGEDNRPPGGGDWTGNPWYPYGDAGQSGGGTTNNPVPQDSFGDAPTDPKYVLYIVQVLCRDTGEKLFEFRYKADNGKYTHNLGDNWTW
jgi:RHS repeat-associated protein